MNSLKVLIVENEILIARQLSKYLEKQKYQVTGIARTGEQALELAKHENPDIILMDIDLDGDMDGIQTAAIVHKTLIIPIIYLTNLKDEQTFERASETLPATYLTKPFKNLDVRNAIEMSIKSLSLLSHDKAKDVNISVELNLKGQKNDQAELYTLKDRLFIKNEDGAYERVMLDEIIYIQTDDHFITLYTQYGERKIKYNLNQFIAFIKNYPIFRINKQTAVNANYVLSIKKQEALLEYTDISNKMIQKSFPIGLAYQNEVIDNFRVVMTKP